MGLERVAEAFSRARRMDPGEREAFLARLDEELRGEVEALLDHHEADDEPDLSPLLEGAAPSVWAELAGPRPPSLAGFTVVRRLGAGAMGTVYEAEQARPRRRVAIKLLHLSTEEGRRRFEREAAMLARLDHPGIARILAQGTEDTPDGPRPFLVMEMVDGVPLTAYARGRRRPEILGLLRQVCAAVAHAHERGVIHRDLKPGNILVGDDGEAKVLDFGLARPVEGATAHTRTGSVLGTLAYMSPEQAAGDPGAIDTRSDVYALGVLAYELLAGRLPLDLEGKTTPAALRVIRETEPPPLPDGGDLAWIVGKAMAKEPERRYSNAAAFADDLARYVADEPVLARPPTATYQLRKFVRRHRALVGGAAATLVALVAGIIVAVRFAHEARRQEARVRHAAALAQLRLARAALDAGEPGVERHLEGVPPGERGWAWEYLSRQCDGSTATVPHDVHVRWAALGDGGRIAAMVSWRNEPFVLDARTAAPLPTPGLGAATGYRRGTIAGGRVWFARAGEGGVVVESTDGRRWTVAGHWPVEGGVVGDPSGRWLAVAVAMRGGERRREVVLLGAVDGVERWRSAVGTQDPLDLAFAGDGSAVAVAQRDGQVRVYDTEDGRERFVVRTGTQNASCIALDRAGTELAVGSLDHSIEVRDAATGALRHRLAGHRAAVRCVAYDPASGRLVSGASDTTMRVWDTRDGACVRILRGQRSAVMAIDFEADGPLHSLSLTDLRTWPREDPDVVRAHAGTAEGNPYPYVYGVAFAPDGTRFASCGWDGTVRVFDATTRRELACFGASAPVRGVAYSRDGKRLAFVHDRVEVRDARTGALQGRYGVPGPRREQVAFLPGGRRLVVGRWHGVELIDLESGAVQEWSGGRSEIGRVACSPDGRLVAHEDGRGGVALRRVEDGEVVARWRAHRRGVRALAFSADGRLLATGGAGSIVRLWSVPGGEPRGTLLGHTLQVYAVAFSPDGRWLASGSDDHTIRLWDVARGEERLVLTGHGRYVFDLAFAPDGKTLASASGDNTVRLWSTGSLRARAALAERIARAENGLRTRFAGRPPAALDAVIADADGIVRRAAGNLRLEWGAKEAER